MTQDTRNQGAAPPRPVDAERVETVTLPAADYQTLVAALEADDTFVKCEICGAWLTSDENSHGADINACWARAVEGGDKASCRSYRASPAHSPDKAVTREGVADARAAFEKHYSRAFDLERATWSDGYASDGVDAIWKGWRECWRALATEPTGTEAGRGALTEALTAIEFALEIDDHYDMREFLKGWSEGDTSEWPEFSVALANATPTPPVSPTPDSTGPTGAAERESEDAYIARVLAMSSDEIAAEAEAADVEVPEPRSLPASLRNLRFRLEAALANRLEEGDREAIAWLNEGVIAIGAALAALSLTPMPSGITPAGASKLWDAIHEAMVCAWNLLDSTEDDASGVDQDDWDALSAAMKAMGMLVPKTEQPFSPSYAVPYLRAALTPSAPIAAPVKEGWYIAELGKDREVVEVVAKGPENGLVIYRSGDEEEFSLSACNFIARLNLQDIAPIADPSPDSTGQGDAQVTETVCPKCAGESRQYLNLKHMSFCDECGNTGTISQGDAQTQEGGR